MSSERTRERIIELVRQMRENTTDNGCTPGEAAKFAAKVARWIEEYQISEAELRAAGGSSSPDEIEVCEHTIATGKKVFNPGVTQVVNSLARGMSCQCVLLHTRDGAVYGIIGEVMDATYVCQLASTIVPALQLSAKLEGQEHGYEKAGLIRWSNQYLTGAGTEIWNRLYRERKERSDAKKAEAARNNSCTALAVITGDMLAAEKDKAAKETLKKLYPRTKKTQSRSEYDHTANQCGRAAGKRVGLHVGINGTESPKLN